MQKEYSPREHALTRVARSISEHQPVRRPHAVGSTCKNRACRGVIFLTRMDVYNHQSVVLVNDLQSDLEWGLECAKADADEEGTDATLPLDQARADYLVLAVSAAPSGSASA